MSPDSPSFTKYWNPTTGWHSQARCRDDLAYPFTTIGGDAEECPRGYDIIFDGDFDRWERRTRELAKQKITDS
jgi:hypothetical protein